MAAGDGTIPMGGIETGCPINPASIVGVYYSVIRTENMSKTARRSEH
jgi:hypothetical protein